MLFAQTLFLIGLHMLPWQRGWGNDFEGLGSCCCFIRCLFTGHMCRCCG